MRLGEAEGLDAAGGQAGQSDRIECRERRGLTSWQRLDVQSCRMPTLQRRIHS